jgi:inhibitor of KinA sporulation pathway (predicted exonuclease)
LDLITKFIQGRVAALSEGRRGVSMGRAGLDKIVVVDLETTCWEKRERDQIMEVIEMGVCLLDIGSGEITDRQSILTRPVYSVVSEFCTNLTSLTQEVVETGIGFREGCLKLEDEYQTKKRVWASYGDFDRRQFERECRLKNIPYPFGSRHINVKTLFAIKHRLTEEIGIDKALALLGLELIGTHHRGVDDAYNAARILYTLI